MTDNMPDVIYAREVNGKNKVRCDWLPRPEQGYHAYTRAVSHPADMEKVREKLVYACDLLAERKYGSNARSPGHNARLVVESVVALLDQQKPATPTLGQMVGAMAERDCAGLREALESMQPATPEMTQDREQEAFDEWAKSNGYDMTMHPLHYLFLDPQTASARQAWKAALMFIKAVK